MERIKFERTSKTFALLYKVMLDVSHKEKDYEKRCEINKQLSINGWFELLKCKLLPQYIGKVSIEDNYVFVDNPTKMFQNQMEKKYGFDEYRKMRIVS